MSKPKKLRRLIKSAKMCKPKALQELGIYYRDVYKDDYAMDFFTMLSDDMNTEHNKNQSVK